jgi:hypothetical protein
VVPYVNFSQMHIRRNMIWICIAYKMYKNFTMQINYIGIKQFFSHIIQRKTQIMLSVFGVRREDTYCAVLKKA